MAEDRGKKGVGIVRHKTWCRPPEGWIKINIDAACHQGSEFIGAGCLARNDRGRFISARANKSRGRGQAREAEAITLKVALTWTKEWRTHKCIFETDCKLLVDALQGLRVRSMFDTIVEDCRELLKSFEEVLVLFVSRSANIIAYLIVQATYSLPGSQEWHNNAPDFVACNLTLEEI